MGKVIVTESSLQGIANAIRAKTGGSSTYTPEEMADGILNIPGGQTVLKDYLLRPDAEKIQTYTYDQLAIEDLGINLPAFKDTAATTLINSSNLTPTITMSYNEYDYYVLERILTIPEYSVTSVAKGREEYQFSSYLYEIVNIPANTFKALGKNTFVTTRNAVVQGMSAIRLLYWSSGSALSVYTSTTYGLTQPVTAPAISSSTLTIKTPTFTFRGHSSYLNSTYYGYVTDIRLQYVIDVYRAPKSNLNIDGWGSEQQSKYILNCINNNNQKLL